MVNILFLDGFFLYIKKRQRTIMLGLDIIRAPNPAGLFETAYLSAQQSPARGVAVINYLNPL